MFHESVYIFFLEHSFLFTQIIQFLRLVHPTDNRNMTCIFESTFSKYLGEYLLSQGRNVIF